MVSKQSAHPLAKLQLQCSDCSCLIGEQMKAKLSQVLYPDHLMYTDAEGAMKRYHEALAAGSQLKKLSACV